MIQIAANRTRLSWAKVLVTLASCFSWAAALPSQTPTVDTKQGRVALPSPYKTCEYDYVQTDEGGNVVRTMHSSARCFDEFLGNGVFLRMIEIPAGDFNMGSPASESGRSADEGPQHDVRVSRFFLAQFEVTEEQYEAMRSRAAAKRKLDKSFSSFVGKTKPQTAADGIPWDGATEFCARLRTLTGKPYRLASEAEWEYAARAGTTTAFEFGPVFAPEIVNNSGFILRKQGQKGTEPLPVGTSGPANAFGLFDMEGNVGEWVLDQYHPNYLGAPSDGSAWINGVRHGERVMRGGDYGIRIEFLRSAARQHWDRGLSASGFGFRVALTVPSGSK